MSNIDQKAEGDEQSSKLSPQPSTDNNFGDFMRITERSQKDAVNKSSIRQKGSTISANNPYVAYKDTSRVSDQSSRHHSRGFALESAPHYTVES